MPLNLFARHAAKPFERLSYGPDKYQFGDLRLPTGSSASAAPPSSATVSTPGGAAMAGLYPVVIVIHGGYWRAAYGLGYFDEPCASLTAQGLATWNIEYRRLGNRGGGWPNTLLDVALAADHLRTLAATYPLDLARVVALGHSAGGHLACWLAARPRIPADAPLHTPDPLPPRATVALAGVVDLRRAWELRLSGAVTQTLLGGTPAAFPARFAAASPYELLPLGVPQVLFHGTADTTVPFEISERYVARARERGDDARLVTLPGAGHFEPVEARTPEWASVQRTVIELARG